MIIKCYNENHPYLLFIDLEKEDSKEKFESILKQEKTKAFIVY